MPGAHPLPHLINNRYEVGEAIGRGGMATVHVGRDLRLGRRVAIKVLRPDLAQDDTFHERFKREAQAVAALNHHSIVSVYDTGEIPAKTEEGIDRPYIVMEYVPGRTLRELIHEDAITPRDAVDVTLGILDALEYSHRAGIVHRDIKPANVIVTPERQVKVMDFGIARAVEDTSPALTQAQAVLGTAQYLSPEQARGQSVDARSDLYSAGCVLFEMLTGRAPFVGESSVGVAAQHVRDDPPAPSEIDPRFGREVDAFIAKALAKDRSARFQDAGQMRRALRELRPAVPGDLDETQAIRPVVAPDDDTKSLPPVPAPVPDPGFGTEQTEVQAGGTGMQTVPPVQVEEQDDGSSTAVRRRGGPLRAALLAMLVLAVLGVLGVVTVQWLEARDSGPALVAVPNVAGMEAPVAETAVRRAGLVPTREEVFSAEVPEGDVVETDPAVDTQVDEGSTIVLEVSKGPEEVQVPDDLIGETEEAVQEALDEVGLEVGDTRPVNSSWAAQGLVIGTDPAAGSTVAVGSEVDLALSTGRVTVPQVVGLSRAEAIAVLSADNARLAHEIVTVPRGGVPPGQVLDQSVDAGQSAPQGATIVLTVAVAPAPQPAPPPTQPPPSPEPTAAATPDEDAGGEEEEPGPTAPPAEDGDEEPNAEAAAASRAGETAREAAARGAERAQDVDERNAERAQEADEQDAERAQEADEQNAEDNE